MLTTIVVFGCNSVLATDFVPPPSAREHGRITLIEENDDLMPRPTDRWYTQGVELSYLSAPIAAGGSEWLLPATASDAKAQSRRFEILIGQSIFTPENLNLSPPDPKDRPYAGWLYGGVGLYREDDHRSLEHLRLLLGIVGPGALAQQAQDGFHVLLREAPTPGWAFQLKDEPGLVFSYERKWRLDLLAGKGLRVDAIPEVGASLGNVFTYAEAGGLVRLGQNLKADYGPARIQPALSGTPWFDPSQLEGPIGWYVFAGAQVRATARNIFLDGNTFASSASVEKRPLVTDFSVGLSVFWLDVAKVDFVVTSRSPEFVGQHAADRFGGINVSFRLP